MRKLDRQRGFSVIASLVIITVVGLAGWFVWQKNKKSDPSPSSNTNSQTNGQADKPLSSDPSEGGKYLVIQEWKIRLLLPVELRDDVIYQMGIFDGKEAAYFAIGRLSAIHNSGCDFSSNTKASGVAIVRTKDKLSEADAPYYYSPNVHIENYWYSGLREKGYSCIYDEKYEQFEIDTTALLTLALKDITKSP